LASFLINVGYASNSQLSTSDRGSKGDFNYFYTYTFTSFSFIYTAFYSFVNGVVTKVAPPVSFLL
jgi:hypothetical protein